MIALCKSDASSSSDHGFQACTALSSFRPQLVCGPTCDVVHLPQPSHTQARAYYAAGLAAGMRNDVPDNVLAMRQVRSLSLWW